SRSGRAHEGEELALGYVEVQVGEDLDLLAAADERLVQAAHADDRLRTHVWFSENEPQSHRGKSTEKRKNLEFKNSFLCIPLCLVSVPSVTLWFVHLFSGCRKATTAPISGRR